MTARPVLLTATLLAFFSPAVATLANTTVINQAVTEAEVLAAQNAWCSALVEISTTADTKGKDAARTLAEKVIDAAYGYQMGGVLFKPTLTVAPQTVAPQTFRTTREGALSYFVGGSPEFPGDTGFALKQWTKCEITNSAIFLDGNSGTTMGNVSFTNKDGKVTVVDKTWQFVKDDANALRIVLHHSSLQYTGN